MVGETELSVIKASLSPELVEGELVYCTQEGASYGDYIEFAPFATVVEREGLTLVVAKEVADDAGWSYEASFRAITLMVHSSLTSVGLTALVATLLADKGISANVIAGYFHDHILVPSDRAEEAHNLLIEASRD